MRLYITLLAVALGFVAIEGCGKAQPDSVTARARTAIDGWSQGGMYLPDAGQIELFQNNVEALTPLLATALSNDNPDVRMRAAYVIERCRPRNSTFANLLADRVTSDGDRLVRIYAYCALCVHGIGSQKALAALHQRWASLDRNAIVETNSASYSEAAEAIYVAGALSACEAADASKGEFVSYVFHWLAPPPKGLSEEMADAYWDMRWSALAALRSMPRTDGAVPLLHAMLLEADTKPWVEAQVKSTLEVQER
ncbi:MAG: hypothetical protein ABSB74_09145 [Tepidisphaeraceae bacterium]